MQPHRPTSNTLHVSPIASTAFPQQSGAKVCLALNDKTDAEVLSLAKAHEVAMANNPNFADPIPSRAVYASHKEELAAIMAELANKRVELQALTARKDQIRAKMNTTLTRRGLYVEITSDGNPAIIATSGFPVRRERKSLGALMWPTNLTVSVTQVTGALSVRWKPIRKARCYVLEITSDDPNTTPEPRWTSAYVGSRASCQIRDLTPGTTYHFRLATIGGAEGQSPWSPIVSRLCA